MILCDTFHHALGHAACFKHHIKNVQWFSFLLGAVITDQVKPVLVSVWYEEDCNTLNLFIHVVKRRV